jgi:predicted regulator of Ras-like GTPase activity (Roadblock/LC7/MglB family)
VAFKTILKGLTEATGAEGAALLDKDGELVDSYSRSRDVEIDLIGAHHGIILNAVKEAASRQEASPEVVSVVISTERLRLAIATVKDGYYLVVAVDRARPAGLALFESRRAVKRIEEEMG